MSRRNEILLTRRQLIGAILGGSLSAMVAKYALDNSEVLFPPKENYSSFIEAYSKLGELALPQSIPERSAKNGERVYDISTPQNTTIPMTVRSLGEISIAPGLHFPKMLAETGWFSSTIASSLTTLRGIDMWLFTEGDNITPDEVLKCSERWPITYGVAASEGRVEVGLSQLVPLFASADPEKLQQNYQEIQASYEPHAEAIYELLLTSAQDMIDLDRSDLPEIYRNHIRSYWEGRKKYILNESNKGTIPGSIGGRFYHHVDPTWAEGEWSAIILAHLDPTSLYVGLDTSYLPQEPLLQNKEQTIHLNSSFLVSQPTLFHELGHAIVGPNEDGANKYAHARLQENGQRMKRDRYEADFIPIYSDSGKVYKNYL